MRSLVAFVTCAIVLALVNYSIAAKERLLSTGRIVFVELAPVDPRSLMQGDYMALRFRLADDVRSALSGMQGASGELPASAGRLVAKLDHASIATFQRIDDGRPLAPDEVRMRYRVRGHEVKFATNAYFFQEGTARRYEAARYGEFRVGDDGELLLTGMRLADLALPK